MHTELAKFLRAFEVRPGEKLSVEKVFDNRGAGVPLDFFKDLEDAKGYFDKPEELALQKVNPSAFTPMGVLVIHKRDTEYVALKLKISNEVLAEWGKPESVDDLLKMKDEIERRLAQLN